MERLSKNDVGRVVRIAPLKSQRRRDRGGTIITRARCHPETPDYLARKKAEGKTTREAIRCLKRHLARRIWNLLQPPHPVGGTWKCSTS